jgi:hypothetical protein
MSHLRLSESKTQSVEFIEESLRSFRLNDDDKENDEKENDKTENDETEKYKTENDETEKDKTKNDVSEIVTHTKKFSKVFFLSFWTVF